MEMTREVCSALEDCALAYGVHKVDFAGDCYTVVEGLEKSESRGNSVRMLCRVGSLMAQTAQTIFSRPEFLGTGLGLRIGIGFGKVTACVFELIQPTLKLFGVPLHSANRAQRGCALGKIALTDDAFAHLLTDPTFRSSGTSTPIGSFLSPQLIEAQGMGTSQTMHIVHIDPPSWTQEDQQQCPSLCKLKQR
jgi:class 3 adenylate cyclase